MEYVYERLRFLNAVPTTRRTGHWLLPKMSDVFAEKVPKSKARVMLSIDLGAIDPKLEGISVPFLELVPGISLLEMRRQKDGRYVIAPSRELKSIVELFEVIKEELEDPFAESLPKKLRKSQMVDFVPAKDELAWGRPLGWSPGEGVYFCHGSRKQYGVESKDWLYAGCVRSEHCLGYGYNFFNRKTSTLRQVFECT